jgi:hypothetical protein
MLVLLLPPAYTGSRTDVLRHATTLAVDYALRLAPAARHSKLPPHVRSSPLEKIDAVRICWERQLECAVQVIAVPVEIN